MKESNESSVFVPLDYGALRVQRVSIGSLPLDDIFFDSLRADYANFDDWFRKKSNEYAYISFDEYTQSIEAFLYLKVEGASENYFDIHPKFPEKKRLKIGTFKVSRKGVKLGERFMRIIFDNALEQRVDEIYLSIYRHNFEQKILILLLGRWGFKLWGNKNKELVYVRSLQLRINTRWPRKSFPFVDGKANLWLMSLEPEVHARLFPDSVISFDSNLNFVEDDPMSNGIVKHIVFMNGNSKVKRGDSIVVGRTNHNASIALTALCVAAADAYKPSSLEEFISTPNINYLYTLVELIRIWRESEVVEICEILHCYTLPNQLIIHPYGLEKIFGTSGASEQNFITLPKFALKIIASLSQANESVIVY